MSLSREELEQNGVAAFVPEIVEHEAVMAELDYALRPIVHEGRIQPYGFIVCDCTDSPLYRRFSQDEQFELNVARKLADGCHSFLVFTQGQFRGVFPLEESAGDELRLTQLQEELRAVICITDNTGTTKIFCSEGVFIHQHRRWQQKPSIKQALHNIEQCIAPVNRDLLQDILAFCFYELSPQKIGATLVWCLDSLKPTDLERLLPRPSSSDLQKKIKLDVTDAIHRAILRHILTYTDGAVFLNRDGLVFGSGAHLKYTEMSRKFIPSYRGTRHTSAKRFSYDFPETVLFVVSSDGLVTVFADGMNIVNLKAYAADDVDDVSERLQTAEAPFSIKSDIIQCQTCKKTFKMQITGLRAYEYNILCPVCSSSLCWTQFNIVKVYVIKDRVLHS